MIKLLTEDKFSAYISFCENHIDGINICTRLYAYGINSPYQTFWYGENENGISFALNKSENILTLCGRITDEEEFLTFINFTGADKIVCEENCFDFDKFNNIRSAVIMEFKGKTDNNKCEKLTGENIKELYNVIFETEKINFNDWYTDISHKIRHNLIRAYGINENGSFISSCITSGETESKAIISAVAVKENYRHKSFGEKTVMSAVNSLSDENKKIYLFTDNDLTVKWYISMGFEIVGRHITISL